MAKKLRSEYCHSDGLGIIIIFIIKKAMQRKLQSSGPRAVRKIEDGFAETAEDGFIEI